MITTVATTIPIRHDTIRTHETTAIIQAAVVTAASDPRSSLRLKRAEDVPNVASSVPGQHCIRT